MRWKIIYLSRGLIFTAETRFSKLFRNFREEKDFRDHFESKEFFFQLLFERIEEKGKTSHNQYCKK